jgi:hypothetical protein
MRKQIAVVVAAVSCVYLFVPEPTDVVPVLGWLDEGAAAAALLWALRSLGVTPGQIFGGVASAADRGPIRDVTPRLRR